MRPLVFGLCFLLALPFSFAADTGASAGSGSESRATYNLESAVLSAGGMAAEGTGLRVKGTLAQPTPVGVGSSTGFRLYAGFWRGAFTCTGVAGPTRVEPLRDVLHQNIPNPFNPLTTIRYEVARLSFVEATVFNIQGRAVRSLVRQVQPPGRYEVFWDGRDDWGRSVGSGVYFYRLETGNFVSTKKMILVK